MTVPDVVGLDVDLARQVASDAGLTLAQPDPAGPHHLDAEAAAPPPG